MIPDNALQFALQPRSQDLSSYPSPPPPLGRGKMRDLGKTCHLKLSPYLSFTVTRISVVDKGIWRALKYKEITLLACLFLNHPSPSPTLYSGHSSSYPPPKKTPLATCGLGLERTWLFNYVPSAKNRRLAYFCRVLIHTVNHSYR